MNFVTLKKIICVYIKGVGLRSALKMIANNEGVLLNCESIKYRRLSVIGGHMKHNRGEHQTLLEGLVRQQSQWLTVMFWVVKDLQSFYDNNEELKPHTHQIDANTAVCCQNMNIPVLSKNFSSSQLLLYDAHYKCQYRV